MPGQIRDDLATAGHIPLERHKGRVVMPTWIKPKGVVVVLLAFVTGLAVAYLLPVFGVTKPMGLSVAQFAFVINLMLFLVAMAIIGAGINDRWTGVLIDSRNRYSVTQLTFYLWTAMVLSAVVAAGLFNAGTKQPDPLALRIPNELIQAMGLAATTLVGTPLIRSVKRGATSNVAPPPAPPAAMAAGGAVMSGRIVQFASAAGARWQDLFQGEEDGNADKADLSRIQLFYLTGVAVAVYGLALFTSLGQVGKLTFPTLDPSLVGLVLLGNGAALAYQAAPHNK